MLLLNPKAESAWETHEETGAQFLLKPMDSEQENALEQRCVKKDGVSLDLTEYRKLFLLEFVPDWKSVGDPKTGALPCTNENKALLARKHGNTIVAWLIRRARSLDHFKAEELAAAKNV